MGAGMAANFLKNNYKVFVWNRSPEKLKPLVNAGATEAASPKTATEQADIIFEVTANDNSSRAVWLGEEGILAGANKNKVLIASGTFTVPWVDELAKKCLDAKLTFFDMPVTGSRAGAEGGQLVLLAGGEKKKLDEIQDELKAISKSVLYFGTAGQGARYKLINNVLSGIHVAAFGEAVKMAEQAGMDVQAVGSALAEIFGGPTASRAWAGYQKSAKPINFAAEWMAKDLSYAKQFAGGLPTPILDEALKKYEKMVKESQGQEDWTAVTRL